MFYNEIYFSIYDAIFYWAVAEIAEETALNYVGDYIKIKGCNNNKKVNLGVTSTNENVLL